MPDLHDFDHFDEGLMPITPLPPAEVRRRGDRLRRRNTGLAAGAGLLVAALAIGAPVLALSGSDRTSDVQPAPAPGDPEPAWVTTIPADFPLTGGFADPDAEPRTGLTQDPSIAVVCGSAGFAGFTDDRVVTYQGESEDRASRILAVYPDADAAEAELAELREAVEGCEPRPVAEGTTMVHEPVEVDLGTEESFGFAQQVRHDDGLVSDLSLFVLGRTGNAIYVDHSYGAAGGDQVVRLEVARLTKQSAEPVAAMCAFAADPCAG